MKAMSISSDIMTHDEKKQLVKYRMYRTLPQALYPRLSITQQKEATPRQPL